ncbi:MAG: S8 family serine peptidase [Anaerolineae bacterium]
MRRFYALVCLAALLTLAAAVTLVSPLHALSSAGPNDPLLGQQWSLTDAFGIHANEAWQYTVGANISIAVLDSGFDLAHPDLADRWVSPYNVLEPGLPQNGDWTDTWGTGVAGLIGATTNNGVGIAGVAWRPNIIPIRVVNRSARNGAPLYSSPLTAIAIAQGLDYAAAHGARIAVFGFNINNLSAADQATVQQAIQRVQDPSRGIPMIVIAPVGEPPLSGSGTPYPASLDGVIGVTATMTDSLVLQVRSTGQLLVQTGPFVDLAAPGKDLLTTAVDGSQPPQSTYSNAQGAEFAAGLVAGAAALVLSVDPTLSPTQVEQILRSQALDRGAPGADPVYGSGIVNVSAAVRATRHFLTLNPNTITLPATVNATATISNPYTLAASWQLDNRPDWLTVTNPQDALPGSYATVKLNRIPSCAEAASGGLVFSSALPLSYSSVTIVVQVAGLPCSTPQSTPTMTPTPGATTPTPTNTPTPTGTPPINRPYKLFLPLLQQRCNSPASCPQPR